MNFDSILCFLMAAFAIYWALAPGGEFYPGRLAGKPKGKPVPKWFGRLWFLGFAVITLYEGIRAWR